MKILTPLLFIIQLALVRETQPQPGIEVGHLPKTGSQYLVFKLRRFENSIVRPEGDGRSRAIRFTNYFNFPKGFANTVLLLKNLALAMYFYPHIGRQCIDAGNTHAVQTSRYLIGVFIKLAPCVQHRHDHLQGRLIQLFVHTRGNTAPIVSDRDRIIRMDHKIYVCTITRQVLIDRVIDDLPYQMVESLGICTSNIHARPLAHGFEPFECRNITGIVVRRVGSNVLSLFHIIHAIKLAKNSKCSIPAVFSAAEHTMLSVKIRLVIDASIKCSIAVERSSVCIAI